MAGLTVDWDEMKRREQERRLREAREDRDAFRDELVQRPRSSGWLFECVLAVIVGAFLSFVATAVVFEGRLKAANARADALQARIVQIEARRCATP